MLRVKKVSSIIFWVFGMNRYRMNPCLLGHWRKLYPLLQRAGIISNDTLTLNRRKKDKITSYTYIRTLYTNIIIYQKIIFFLRLVSDRPFSKKKQQNMTTMVKLFLALTTCVFHIQSLLLITPPNTRFMDSEKQL